MVVGHSDLRTAGGLIKQVTLLTFGTLAVIVAPKVDILCCGTRRQSCPVAL